MKNKRKNVLLIAAALIAVALLTLVPLLTVKGSFGGSDDAAGKVVEQVDPNYKPIVSKTITERILGGELPEETESMLFALQAAIGAGIIGYGFGVLKTKYKEEKKQNDADR